MLFILPPKKKGLTLAGVEAEAGSGATLAVPEAAGACGPPRTPFNLPNMSRNVKMNLLISCLYEGNVFFIHLF